MTINREDHDFVYSDHVDEQRGNTPYTRLTIVRKSDGEEVSPHIRMDAAFLAWLKRDKESCEATIWQQFTKQWQDLPPGLRP